MYPVTFVTERKAEKTYNKNEESDSLKISDKIFHKPPTKCSIRVYR